MQQFLFDELGDFRSFEKGFGQREVRALEQRCVPNAIEGELVAHLLIETRVGKGVCRKLVLQKAANDFFRVDDRVQGHEGKWEVRSGK